MRKAVKKYETDVSLSAVNLQRKKRKIGADLIGQTDILQTKRNLCEDRKFNEDEDFGNKCKEFNGARNLSPAIDICSNQSSILTEADGARNLSPAIDICSNQPPIPTEADDVEILETGTIHTSPAIDICSNQLPNPEDYDDVEILELGTNHKDNDITDSNNNGEWKERSEKKERFTKRKNVKKNMKNNKKNEDDKNKKFYRKLIKEVERAFDLGQRKQIQEKIALAPYNKRLVSLMPL